MNALQESLLSASGALKCLVIAVLVSPTALCAEDDSVVTVKDVVVDFASKIDVPARHTGPVTVLNARQNQWFQSGQLIAKLDDTQLLIRQRSAQLKQAAARLVIEDEVEIRYAETALAEAEAELDDSRAVDERVSGAVARNQMRRLKLAVKRSELELARAEKQRKHAEIEWQLRSADLSTLDHELQQLQCVSPIDGVVLNVHRRLGEWVHAGDPIVTLADAAVLHLHALVHADDLDAAQCVGLPVSVDWTKQSPTTGEEKLYSLRGKVLSVDPMRLPGNRFRLHAEVANRRNVITGNEPLVSDGWQLVPGMEVTMKIHRSDAELAWRHQRAKSGSLR